MLQIFDIETYFNFFSATFKDYKTKQVKQFVIFEDRDDSQELIEFIDNSELWLCGYNNYYFDNQILKYMWENRFMYMNERPVDIAQHIYKFAMEIINDDWKDHVYNLPFKSLDLMKIGNLQQKSLKLTGTIFKWHKLQDLPYKMDKVIVEEDVDTILKYNLNDVEITEKLCELLEPQIKLRFNVSKEYGVNVYSESDSGIANKLLEKFYAESSGLTTRQFKHLRTKRPRIGFWDVIFPDVEFQTRQLEDFLDKFRQTIFYSSTPFMKKTLIFDGVKYTVGIGGLHSDDQGKMFESSDKQKIVDCDIASMYPNLMIHNNIHPQHLGHAFMRKYKEIVDIRVEAKKKAKDKRRSQESRDKYRTIADTMKITANSCYGKMKFENHWLYDPLAALRVTINGQLYLLMLIEQLVLNGFKIISANTDGVITIIPTDREDEYKEVCAKWEKLTNFELEYTYYKKYARRDVNNYIAITEAGDVKTKGDLNINDVTRLHEDQFMLRRGFDKPIVAIAINEYFINNTPIEETIRNHKDIYDFCTAKKTDKKFINKFHYIENNEVYKDTLQQSVRYYVSTNGGSLYKEDPITNKAISYCVGKRVTIFNDYFEYTYKRTGYVFSDFDKYNIDYNYYIHETQKVIDEIIKPQLTLF